MLKGRFVWCLFVEEVVHFCDDAGAFFLAQALVQRQAQQTVAQIDDPHAGYLALTKRLSELRKGAGNG